MIDIDKQCATRVFNGNFEKTKIELPKGFREGKCKCGNLYGYCGLDIGYCVECIDAMSHKGFFQRIKSYLNNILTLIVLEKTGVLARRDNARQ